MKGQSVGPYRVLRKLGAGGMGDVYLAEDDRLGRRVALKSPSDAWLETPDARVRLQREARAAARLNHPNIAAVYDVLESGGRPFIVMEHVDGESLAAVLSRGRVPLERALSIAVQLARALEAAHAAGIVHRDLKPGNVMITPEGVVKVLDFGLAKLPDVDAEAGPLTSPGQVLGTPGYVAPEQLLGHRADARSDIYSAGAIVYQLVCGRAPWGGLDERGRSLSAILAPVPNLATVDATIPKTVCDIVARAMEREPRDRYASASEFRRALEQSASAVGESPTATVETPPVPKRHSSRATIAVASLLLLIAAATPFLWRWRSASITGSKAAVLPVVAVLPLQNISNDPSLDYIGAGMAETMSTKLASVSGLAVVSRSEIHDALTRKIDTAQLSRALGATFVVTGAVQQAANRLQVTINLNDAGGARIVTGDIYEDSLDNLFALQRRIAEGLTRRLVGTLSSVDQERLARNPTNSVQALSAYWRGRDLLDTPGPAPVDPAIDAFKEAVSRDPSFAVGYAALGGAYWRKYNETREPEWARKSVQETERARQIDPNQVEVRYALATVYRGNGRADAAIAELKRVLDLQPTHEAAHRMLGEIYESQGKMTEALAEYNDAIRIRPDYWGNYRALGVANMRSGDYEEALKASTRITELQPDSPYGFQLRGTVYGIMGNPAAATKDYEAALARGGTPATNSSLGTVYYMQGRFEEAARSYERAIQQRPRNATTHWNLGDAYRRLGRTADATRAYQQAIRLFDADLSVNPKDADAIATRATCLARIERQREALQESERAVQLAPANQDVLYQRALVLLIAGQRDGAIDALQRAVASGYSVGLLRDDADLKGLADSPKFRALIADRGAAPRRTR